MARVYNGMNNYSGRFTPEVSTFVNCSVIPNGYSWFSVDGNIVNVQALLYVNATSNTSLVSFLIDMPIKQSSMITFRQVQGDGLIADSSNENISVKYENGKVKMEAYPKLIGNAYWKVTFSYLIDL